MGKNEKLLYGELKNLFQVTGTVYLIQRLIQRSECEKSLFIDLSHNLVGTPA